MNNNTPQEEIENYEIERKFILHTIPSIFLTNAKQSEITQYYIPDESSMLRVRKIIENDKTTYIQTIKNSIGSKFAVSEKEIELSEEVFNLFVKQATSKISKKRYTLYIENNKWEIDIFHELNLIMAELEKICHTIDEAIELEKTIKNIEIPDSIKEVFQEEVTGKEKWSNKYLSLKIK